MIVVLPWTTRTTLARCYAMWWYSIAYAKEAAGVMRHLRWLLVALAVVGCELPKDVVRPPSSALVDTHHTLDATSSMTTSAWGRRSATATSTSWRWGQWCRSRLIR